MGIFDKLIDERIRSGIKMSDMADMLNIHSKSIGNYERGDRRVPYHIVEGYAEKLGYELKLMLK